MRREDIRKTPGIGDTLTSEQNKEAAGWPRFNKYALEEEEEEEEGKEELTLQGGQTTNRCTL